MITDSFHICIPCTEKRHEFSLDRMQSKIHKVPDDMTTECAGQESGIWAEVAELGLI